MNRRLYDLCRKYRYFYKKHEDVKSWNRKYHDIDLSYILEKTKYDLELVSREIQLELFNVFDVGCKDIKITREIPQGNYSTFDAPMPQYIGNVDVHCTVEFENSEFFIHLLKEYLEKGNWK